MSWKAAGAWEWASQSYNRSFLRIVIFIFRFAAQGFLRYSGWGESFRVVGFKLQSWNKKMEKTLTLQSSFSWIQFYSTFGLKAAKIACGALEDNSNVGIISTRIYVCITEGFILRSLLYVLKASSSCCSFASPKRKLNFNVRQHVIPYWIRSQLYDWLHFSWNSDRESFWICA